MDHERQRPVVVPPLAWVVTLPARRHVTAVCVRLRTAGRLALPCCCGHHDAHRVHVLPRAHEDGPTMTTKLMDNGIWPIYQSNWSAFTGTAKSTACKVDSLQHFYLTTA